MILCQSHTSLQELEYWIDREKPDAIFALTDSNTFAIFQNYFQKWVPDSHVAIIPWGEQHKNLQSAGMIWDMLVEEGATRKSLLINFGGGIVTDLGGFAASTFMRGIRFINIPTSLLAMVDAAEGGKTGINYGHYKNYIGTFSSASEVFIDSTWLKHLPANEIVNGWAEVIKHAIISGNPLWEIIEKGIPEINNSAQWDEIIAMNIQIKSEIVAEDPIEKGKRKVLNLGHTIAHALEALFLSNTNYLSHGEAVAAGIAIEVHIASNKGLLNANEKSKILRTIHSVFSKVNIYKDNYPILLEYIRGDKKNHGGNILMTLPESIGKVVWDVAVSDSEISKALDQYLTDEDFL